MVVFDSVHFRSFNTQPPEGGWAKQAEGWTTSGSFNTQPPEGGWTRYPAINVQLFRFNTQPPEGGWVFKPFEALYQSKFQHTAARRRLALCLNVGFF